MPATDSLGVTTDLAAVIPVLFEMRYYFPKQTYVAYDLMTDFSQPIGGSRNYSGPQMTLGLSLLLGGKTGGS